MATLIIGLLVFAEFARLKNKKTRAVAPATTKQQISTRPRRVLPFEGLSHLPSHQIRNFEPAPSINGISHSYAVTWDNQAFALPTALIPMFYSQNFHN